MSDPQDLNPESEQDSTHDNRKPATAQTSRLNGYDALDIGVNTLLNRSGNINVTEHLPELRLPEIPTDGIVDFIAEVASTIGDIF